MTETGHFTDRDGPVSGVDAHAAAGTSWTGPETRSRLRASDRRAPSLQAGADGARSLHEPFQRGRAEAVPVPGQADQPRGKPSSGTTLTVGSASSTEVAADYTETVAAAVRLRAG